MGNYKKDYSESVKELCSNRLYGFQSRQDDAQFVANVVNVLANEKNMTVNRAQAILSDATKLIPLISVI